VRLNFIRQWLEEGIPAYSHAVPGDIKVLVTPRPARVNSDVDTSNFLDDIFGLRSAGRHHVPFKGKESPSGGLLRIRLIDASPGYGINFAINVGYVATR